VRKLTNEIVDQKLIGRNIKRLGNYIDTRTKIEFECLVFGCEYKWITLPYKILTEKHGCHKCAGHIKLTNFDVDTRLEGTYIKRIGNYINNNTKIKFECLVIGCGHKWSASPNNILSGKSGCPKCSGNLPLTNEIVDDRLVGRNLQRVGNYINNKIKIKFKCLIKNCGYKWKSKVDNIFYGNGCPKCSGNLKLTNKDVDDKLIGTNIKRIDKYININTKIRFKCLTCNYKWKTSPSKILNTNHGCPMCGGSLKLNNKIVDERLLNSGIKRIDEYININTKIYFECLNNKCKHVWKTTPGSILCSETRCPKCKTNSRNEKLIYKILKENNIDINYQYNIKNFDINEKYNYRLDFYIPKNNLIIEYNGHQHYMPRTFGGQTTEQATIAFKKQQVRDDHIQKFSDNKNINIIWIDGRKLKGKKLENYINTKILPLL
jgi:hypothetical protein